MKTYIAPAEAAAPPAQLCIDRQLWDLWELPQVRRWLQEVPRQQRLKRLEQVGRLWEGAARWALMRTANPKLSTAVLERLTSPADPRPFAAEAVAPPAVIERLVLERGFADGIAWAEHRSPIGCAELAQGGWVKADVWHPELQAWVSAP